MYSLHKNTSIQTDLSQKTKTLKSKSSNPVKGQAPQLEHYNDAAFADDAASTCRINVVVNSKNSNEHNFLAKSLFRPCFFFFFSEQTNSIV